MKMIAALLMACALHANATYAAEMEIVVVDKALVRVCPAPCPRTAVFFIHGLGGSVDTWKNDTANSFWPKLLADDQDIGSKIDVYVVGYASTLLTHAPPVTKIGRTVATKLDEIIIDERNYQRVIFIAHSLGGIVSVNYLSHLKTAKGHRDLARARLLVTLGSPLKGGNGARLGAAFSLNPQVRILVDINRNDYMQLVTNNWAEILQKRANHACGQFRIFSAFEERGLLFRGLGIVVDERSATAFAKEPGDETKGFPVDHHGLARPTSRTDPIYSWTKTAIRNCTDQTGFCEGEISPNCQ